MDTDIKRGVFIVFQSGLFDCIHDDITFYETENEARAHLASATYGELRLIKGIILDERVVLSLRLCGQHPS